MLYEVITRGRGPRQLGAFGLHEGRVLAEEEGFRETLGRSERIEQALHAARFGTKRRHGPERALLIALSGLEPGEPPVELFQVPP